MPDVPAGKLYLGDRVDPGQHARANDLVFYDAADLTTHGVIVGMTGSGKTGLGVVLLEEALLSGVPTLILDPKGDLTNLLLTFPELSSSEFAPWINPSEVQKSGKTVDEYAADVATTWRDGLAGWDITGDRIRALKDRADFTIYTPGSTSGVPLDIIGDLHAPEGVTDPEILQDEIEDLVASLLALVGIESDPLSGREHILLANIISTGWAAGRHLDLATLVAQVQDPPLRKLGVIDLDTFFPKKDRTALALKLNGLLASPAFASWAQGVPLDMQRLLYGDGTKPQAAIVELAHLSDQERQFVTTIVLSKLVTWFRRQPGTPDLRVLVYMDEVFGFVPPTASPPAKKPILTILKQARAFGVGMVLSTQNPVDLDYKAISNAGTWMIGRLQTERDKARLLEGLKDAAGATDVGEIADTISGLAKREFVLHSTKANAPTVFTSRWAMSYLPGPLSRDQIATLMQGAPARAAVTPTATATGTAVAGTAAPASASSPAAAQATAADETSVAPPVAIGVRTYYLDPAARWASDIGASPGATRLAPALITRCLLMFDDTKAGVREQHEWEAVFFPLDGRVRVDQAVTVDYDERDLRDAAPDSAVYTLPSVNLGDKALYATLRSDLQDHLFRTQSMQLFRNTDLKLFSRPGESREDFEHRCNEAADENTDAEASKLRDEMTAKMDRVREAIDRAQDRVREVETDQRRRGLDAVVSVAGGVLGSFLGGKRNTKSILTTLGRATSKGGMTKAAGERLETAKNRLGSGQADLAQLEEDLAAKLREIADRWDAKAARIDTIDIALEKSDVKVDELAVVWLPVA